MNSLTKFVSVLVLAAAVVTPVVLGRYGDVLATLLRADVLLGFGFVATLVALITLEYGRRVVRAARQPATIRGMCGATPSLPRANFISLRKDNVRVAA